MVCWGIPQTLGMAVLTSKEKAGTARAHIAIAIARHVVDTNLTPSFVE
jgi:hypothetical protein